MLSGFVDDRITLSRALMALQKKKKNLIAILEREVRYFPEQQRNINAFV